MKKRKVFITSKLFNADLQRFDTMKHEVKIHDDLGPDLTEEDLINIGNDYDIIISNLTNKFTKRVLDNSKRLKLISNIAVGYDNIDIESATKNQIIVTTTPDVLQRSVAEFAVGLLLMACKNVSCHQYIQKEKTYPRWSPTFSLGMEISGKEVGIIGLGQIGQEIGRILHFGFSCKISYLKNKTIHQLDYPTTPLEKNVFFSSQKIFIIACPLNEDTRNLFGKQEIQTIGKGSILVNISRGEIIDQTALLQMKNKFSGIALDVTTPDPLPNNHPMLKDEKFFITPHIASATQEARSKMIDLAVQNAIDFDFSNPNKIKNAVNSL